VLLDAESRCRHGHAELGSRERAERQRLTEQPARAMRKYRSNTQTQSEHDEFGMIGQFADLE
jgi:hypothetical protein